MIHGLRTAIAAVTLLLGGPPLAAAAQQSPAIVAESRDGQRDFDWEIGEWTTRLSRLQRPLSGSSTWVKYEGVTVVRPVLDGSANLVELKVEGPAGRIEGLSLRLYDPDARQWSLNFAGGGVLTRPVYGKFRDGRGVFYGQDTLGARAILVRFIISDVTANSARFEQAFSDDGGITWEVNWIAVDTRRGTSA
ncbi:hypothetical protein PMI01_02856 [Caulobacter sp. AP07]|uniref:hypothetical protein n=1 Tax=Caulobacter sp. AP07 TaxID=1144304 RepID=UPI000272254A|nr:hypothetical protein [Caulobacter sp. AP07]EJL31192.1 hypothetical protein PMI01_02856 [Caulobacter sp. AP07]